MEDGDWKGITSITFPNSVRKIHKYAFNQCTGIKSVVFPANLEYLDDYAMWGMVNLESIIFNGVLPPRMGRDVFYAYDFNFEGFPPQASINIPYGNYLNWHDILFALGEDYASALVVPDKNRLTYNFNYNDGTEGITDGSYVMETMLLIFMQNGAAQKLKTGKLLLPLTT